MNYEINKKGSLFYETLCNNIINLQCTPVHCIAVAIYTGPDLGGPGGAGPQASHQQGVSHQTPQFLKPRNSIANPGLHNFCYHLCIVK